WGGKGMHVGIPGPLQVEVGGSAVDVGTGKRGALLALLAIRPNRVVPTDEIVDGLWRGQPTDTAKSAIQTYVHALRRLLPADVLLTHPGGYALTLAPDELDASQFDALVHEAEGDDQLPERVRDLLTQALAFWRGRALQGFDHEWAEPEAARLETLRLLAVE